jgi:hypothetical protein
VKVASRDGDVETRSTIYTEYFVRGSQPTTACSLHPSPSLFDRIGGLFGAGDGTPIVKAEEVGLSPPPQVTAREAASRPDDEPAAKDARPPEKKRGFWSRLFGLGGDRDEKKKEADRKREEKKPKKPGGG